MKQTDVSISLKSVREIRGASVVNRRAALRAAGQVDMAVRVVPDIERSTVSLLVTASYIYAGPLRRERLMTCSALAAFEIENLMQHVEINGEDVVVASRVMMTMLGIAVGALRGIIAVRTAGTTLANRPLPIIDLTALMYRLHYGSAPEAVFRT